MHKLPEPLLCLLVVGLAAVTTTTVLVTLAATSDIHLVLHACCAN